MSRSIKIFLIIFFLPFVLFAQKENKDSIKSSTFNGLKWRSIGPALTSGRIADFAVNPFNHSEYYVAVASGHVWKTKNAGTTYEPVFDSYGSYSIGCVKIDPTNPSVVWVGTGENNHQRSLGYGDGVYKSIDGGKSWKNMGLKDSRQIGGIVIDPRHPDVVYVAAEGSVWGPGGDRGLYKTTDGGKTWKKILEISENTGVNNIIFDPRNPDVLYATSEQRRRHVFTKIGGGPESAVYKSTDAGQTWEKIMNGLPSVDIGGMGIDISPVNPDVIYLIVEAADKQGGFFRTTNRGASWEKMSDHTEQGQYYNEIFCDPKDVNKVYSVETISHVTKDGGKTWIRLSNNGRHVDDHAIWIDPTDTKHFLIGGDGGVYETFDEGETYDFKENLPVTQFYRVNVDNTFPFYYVYGGTQDNNSMGGPSRTIRSGGIFNCDWFITNGGDGFWTAVDPENPNIVYAEAQYGNMVRYDRQSREMLSIRPEPGKDELTYRWNWNTPLFISPHKNTRLYCSANKVFRSDDRGNTWQVISEDLTAQIDRNTWPVMEKYWSTDAVRKDYSTSLYGIIISLTESPLKENLLYAGTDDGLIQVSEDAKTWRKIDKFPGVPEYTYVSDILADKFNENIVYASFDNILRDDFKPYLLKSEDKGKTWKSIAGNLPANGTIHTIEQDFINPSLLFVGTEFGVFFTTNGGENWIQLKNGLPTIQVRDMVIQKRESDLVIATFGRGFYVLDDYSPLRTANKELFSKDAYIFPVKDALMYVPSWDGTSQGSTFYKAPNPEFGACFTYYIKEVPKTMREIRKEKEKELFKDGKPIPQVTDSIRIAEERELPPYLLFSIYDENGNVVRKITTNAKEGINRIYWDLTYSGISPVKIKDKFNPTEKTLSGTLSLPGNYKVSLSLINRDGLKELVSPVEFKTVLLRNTTLPSDDLKELVAFQKKAADLQRNIDAAYNFLKDLINRTEYIKQTIINTPAANYDLLKRTEKIANALDDILGKFDYKSAKPSYEENPPHPPTINDRLENLVYTHWRATSNLTQNEITAYNVLMEEFPPVHEEIKRIYNVDIKSIENELEKIKAPWTPGRLPEMK